jgi:ribosomal protein L37E
MTVNRFVSETADMCGITGYTSEVGKCAECGLPTNVLRLDLFGEERWFCSEECAEGQKHG